MDEVVQAGPGRRQASRLVRVTLADASPDRLRLAAHAVVLRRDAAELQVGIDPAVVVPLAYGVLLDRLVGASPEVAVLADAGRAGLPDEGTRAVLAALTAAGLLHRDAVPRPTPPVLRLVGAGPLARRTASVLAAAGVRAFHVADLPGPPIPAPGVGPRLPDRVELLAGGLLRRHPDVVVHRLRHWAKPDGIRVDLTVVAADGPETDRLVTDTLLAADQPHLLVRSSGEEVSVGPLVVPGRTSCVRCTDLHRRDADRQWPWVLAQLTRVRLEPAPSLLAWGSSCAAAQALAFLAGRLPESAGHTLELGTRDHALRMRPWPVHPECGCGWPGAPV